MASAMLRDWPSWAYKNKEEMEKARNRTMLLFIFAGVVWVRMYNKRGRQKNEAAPPQHHLSPNQIKPNYAIAISAKLSLIRQR
jgi:hypothetical protein